MEGGKSMRHTNSQVMEGSKSLRHTDSRVSGAGCLACCSETRAPVLFHQHRRHFEGALVILVAGTFDHITQRPPFSVLQMLVAIEFGTGIAEADYLAG